MYIRFGKFLDLLTDLVIPTVKGGGKLESFGNTSINNARV
jgi:hypothetical protein